MKPITMFSYYFLMLGVAMFNFALSNMFDSEISALLALYNSTSGKTWKWRNVTMSGPRWNFTQDDEKQFVDDPCNSGGISNLTWQGLSCLPSPKLCFNHSVQLCQVSGIVLDAYNLAGTIPSEISDLGALESLSLAFNMLSRSIPSEIHSLSSLKNLRLNVNILSSTIPYEMCDLVLLTKLNLRMNMLNGSIPESIYNLSKLIAFDIRDNLLSGSISKDISKLIFLDFFAVSENKLVGSIPVEIKYLSRLNSLYLEKNQLTGKIPIELQALYLPLLSTLDVSDNFLTSSIPREIFSLSSLSLIYFHSNFLTGSIDDNIGNLSSVAYFDFHRNMFTGSVPAQVGNLFSLLLLDFDNNMLSGSIPTEIGAVSGLEWLEFDVNFMTGSIPSGIGLLSSLEWFDLDDNFFSSSIPPDIGKLLSLEYIGFSHNLFTGAIPSEIGVLTNLVELFLSSNRLAGGIPSSVGELSLLKTLDVSNNRLDGSIPPEIYNLKKLISLFLQNNALSGNLDNVFKDINNNDDNNTLAQSELTVIDVSNNLLTGFFSDQIFGLPKLSVLALSVNCIKTELNLGICLLRNITTLSLNGLNAADDCKDQITFPISGVSLATEIGGTIPPCVWELPLLEVLHLTGNGLTGTLIPQLPANSQIKNLKISHNQLSGTIPTDILRVLDLDLSYNRLDGTINKDVSYCYGSYLNLEVNRISGRLSVSKLESANVTNLEILKGNLFACSDIPENDEFAHDYVCGSENFNQAIYIFGLIFVGVSVTLIAFGILLLVPWSSRKGSIMSLLFTNASFVLQYLRYAEGLNSEMQNIKDLRNDFKLTVRLAIQLLLIFFIVCSPIYILKWQDQDIHTYSTHYVTFSWFWTISYMRGPLPAFLILMTWVLVITLCFYRMKFCLLDKEFKKDLLLQSEKSKLLLFTNESTSTTYTLFYKRIIIFVLPMVVNIVIIVGVNVLYIISTQQPYTPSTQFVILMSFAVFRLLYANNVYPVLARAIDDQVSNIWFRLQIMTLNNLFIPCVVTAFTSPSCFQGLLYKPDAITTTYSYELCDLQLITPTFGNICISTSIVEVDSSPFIPPFSYNHQCSSVLLTAYIPVLLVAVSFQIVTSLVLSVLCIQLKSRIVTKIIYTKVLKGILWPELWLPGSDSDLDFAKKVELLEKDPSYIMDTKSMLCFDVLNNLIIMLTFGLCSPILATAVVCLVVFKFIIWIIFSGRFCQVLNENSFGNEKMHFAIIALSKVYIPLEDVLRRNFWQIAFSSAFFFSLICWDIASDDVGYTWNYFYIPLIAICYPILLWIIHLSLVYRNRLLYYLKDGDRLTVRETETELSTSFSFIQKYN